MRSPQPHDLPAVQLLYLAEVMKQGNVSTKDFFGSVGIDEAKLGSPDARVSMTVVQQIVSQARTLLGDRPLGLAIGMQMRASAFGQLGLAATSAPTARDALQVVARYSSIATDALSFRLTEAEGTAVITIDENVDLGEAREVVLFAISIGLWQMGALVTGIPLAGTLGFAIPPPAYAPEVERLAKEFDSFVRFGEATNTLTFDAAMLSRPLVTADPAGHRLALEQCERALASRPSETRLVHRVRSLLADENARFPTLEEVASSLHVSARTLKRRLAEHDTTFSELLDDARQERATLLLASSGLAIKEVAERVGYSEVANFTRAFRRWTGSSPGVFRRQASASTMPGIGRDSGPGLRGEPPERLGTKRTPRE